MRLPMKQLFTQITLIIALALMCAACAEQTNLYSVTGTSSQAYLDGNTAYMKLMDGGSYRDIDSCTVLHGNFQMSGPLDSVMCVSLFMGDTYDINNRPILVVLEEGNVKVNIGYSSVKAEGTPLNERLYHFLAKRDSIGMMLIDPNLTRMELIATTRNTLMRSTILKLNSLRRTTTTCSEPLGSSTCANVLFSISTFLQTPTFKRFTRKHRQNSATTRMFAVASCF